MDLKAYWDDVHTVENATFLTLSGTWIRRIFESHKALHVTDNILEVGVGNGSNIMDMKSRGYTIHAFDISTVALEKLKVKADVPTYFTYDQLPRNYFDAIMSFHVSEHMSPDQLKEQISVMLECLKSKGTFLMSFATPLDVDPHRNLSLEDKMKVGAIYYTKEQIEDIVKECSGISEIFSIQGTCFGVIITKKENKSE